MARCNCYCEDDLSGALEIAVVWEDERVLAFHPPRPQSEFHAVVTPKDHLRRRAPRVARDGTWLFRAGIGLGSAITGVN